MCHLGIISSIEFDYWEFYLYKVRNKATHWPYAARPCRDAKIFTTRPKCTAHMTEGIIS
jgi:hypothetical protein